MNGFKIVFVLETLFLSSEKESVLLSSGDDLNPIHAKVRYCIVIVITYLIIVADAADAADAVSVNFSGRCKFLLI